MTEMANFYVVYCRIFLMELPYSTVSTGETEPLSPPSIPVKSLDDLDLVPTREVPSSHPFYLPEDISSPIPPEWNSVEDEFVWITPIFLSHLGKSNFSCKLLSMN